MSNTDIEIILIIKYSPPFLGVDFFFGSLELFFFFSQSSLQDYGAFKNEGTHFLVLSS